MYIYEVWYTKPNGEFMMAWQGLLYTQAWLKVKEMAALGYDNACVCFQSLPGRHEGGHDAIEYNKIIRSTRPNN